MLKKLINPERTKGSCYQYTWKITRCFAKLTNHRPLQEELDRVAQETWVGYDEIPEYLEVYQSIPWPDGVVNVDHFIQFINWISPSVYTTGSGHVYKSYIKTAVEIRSSFDFNGVVGDTEWVAWTYSDKTPEAFYAIRRALNINYQGFDWLVSQCTKPVTAKGVEKVLAILGECTWVLTDSLFWGDKSITDYFAPILT